MERPKRAAAEKARELILAGIGRKCLENDDVKGLSSDEEDDLDEILSDEIAADLVDLSEDPGEATSTGGTVRTIQPNRLLSYEDVDDPPEVPAFTPVRPPGLHAEHDLPRLTRSNVRPLDFFQLFFSVELLQMICDMTNLYAWMNILSKPSYARESDGAWVNVTVKEMQSFLALIIMMGFITRRDIPRYWCQATLYSGGWARRLMSRNCFKALLGMLHVSHPSHEDPNDKLTKIRPVLQYISERCTKYYQPHQQLSVDERMVKSKGRSGIMQYIPMKPIRFGFKLWCICDAKNGYTLDFDVYTGKRERPSPNGLGFDVVTRLVRKYMDQGYHVFFDNFFTSLKLIKHLKDVKVFACGTTTMNRRGCPKELKDQQWVKTAERGDTRYMRVDGIFWQQWLDNRPVCICSSIHRGDSYVPVKRRQYKKNSDNKVVTVKKPTSIQEYNISMGGVDLSNQRLHDYHIFMKSVRWWKTLFFHMLDLSVLNSFLLYKEWCKENKEPDSDVIELTHLTFREELVRQLGGIQDHETTPFYLQVPRRRSAMDYANMHLPMYTESRRNCRVCYQLTATERKSKWTCSHPTCSVYLCLNGIRNCFAKWHSEDFESYRDAL